MSSEIKPSIIEQRLKLEGERKRKMEEFIKPYDRKVFNPAMTKLREECAAEGHDIIARITGIYHICGKCGESYIGKGK